MNIEFVPDLKVSESLAIKLIDPLAGVVAVVAREDFAVAEDLQICWQLQCDGVEQAAGTLKAGDLRRGVRREYRLSYPVPAVLPGGVILLLLFVKSATLFPEMIPAAQFFLPVCEVKPLPAQPGFITGIRNTATGCFISAGKLSAVIEGNGLNTLAYNGDTLILRGPRLNIYRAPRSCDGNKFAPEPGSDAARFAAERFDRIKVVPDHFICGDHTAECRSLGLPCSFDGDEFEFTQNFTPRSDGVIAAEFTFVVPGSFAGIPRLGVLLEVPEHLGNVCYFGCGPDENYADSAHTQLLSVYRTTVDEMYVPYPVPQDCGNRCNTFFAAFTPQDGAGAGLLIVPGGVMEFSALKFSAAALAGASAQDELHPEHRILVSCDLRQSAGFIRWDDPLRQDAPRIHPGCYRLQLFFKALLPGDDPAVEARKIRAFQNSGTLEG